MKSFLKIAPEVIESNHSWLELKQHFVKTDSQYTREGSPCENKDSLRKTEKEKRRRNV